MRRFLRVWGPDLVGGSLCVGAATVAMALGVAAHWVAMAPCIPIAIASLVATICDLSKMDFEHAGPHQRGKDFDAEPKRPLRCAACATKQELLDKVTKDRDELREALVVLRLPEDRP